MARVCALQCEEFVMALREAGREYRATFDAEGFIVTFYRVIDSARGGESWAGVRMLTLDEVRSEIERRDCAPTVTRDGRKS